MKRTQIKLTKDARKKLAKCKRSNPELLVGYGEIGLVNIVLTQEIISFANGKGSFQLDYSDLVLD